MESLIAEDLLLVLLDERSGRLRHTTYLDVGLGGALLVDLALAGTVEVVRGGGLWARSKVHPVVGAPVPADPLLIEALKLVAARQRTAQDLVGRLGKRRRGAVLTRLEHEGVLARRRDTLAGVFPRTRWAALDTRRAGEPRRRVSEALVRGVQPDQRTAALVALLASLEVAHKVVEREGLSAGEVKRRAKTIAEGDWAAKAVKDAVAAARAAVAASVAVTTTAATSG